MATRVQTQLLPEAPNLQPTVSAGGRYTVQVQQAGKNKWHALADTLSQINPALANYSAAMQTRNKMLMKEGYIDYQSDQKKMEQELATFKAEQEKTKNGIRKLVNQGLLPDDANAVRMIGALKAKAETMVNRQYRGTSPIRKRWSRNWQPLKLNRKRQRTAYVNWSTKVCYLMTLTLSV